MSNLSEVEEINRGVQFIFETLMYTIWQSKLEKKIYSATKFNMEMDYYISASFKVSNKIWELIYRNNMFRRYGDGPG